MKRREQWPNVSPHINLYVVTSAMFFLSAIVTKCLTKSLLTTQVLWNETNYEASKLNSCFWHEMASMGINFFVVKLQSQKSLGKITTFNRVEMAIFQRTRQLELTKHQNQIQKTMFEANNWTRSNYFLCRKKHQGDEVWHTSPFLHFAWGHWEKWCVGKGGRESSRQAKKFTEVEAETKKFFLQLLLFQQLFLFCLSKAMFIPDTWEAEQIKGTGENGAKTNKIPTWVGRISFLTISIRLSNQPNFKNEGRNFYCSTKKVLSGEP